MAEEKKEPWLNYLAFTTIVFAVCATLSTFKGGSFSTKSVLSQALATDKWSYYQSKSIKMYLNENQKENFEMQMLAVSKNNPELGLAYQSRIDKYKTKVKKYENEKEVIKKEAIALELARDEAQVHSKTFGEAVIFLQIAILLSSIAALVKKKYLWYIATILGIIGVILFADGFFLFINVV